MTLTYKGETYASAAPAAATPSATTQKFIKEGEEEK